MKKRAHPIARVADLLTMSSLFKRRMRRAGHSFQRPFLLATVFMTFLVFSYAHKAGEEFTYLSLFSEKPKKAQGLEDVNVLSVYQEFSGLDTKQGQESHFHALRKLRGAKEQMAAGEHGATDGDEILDENDAEDTERERTDRYKTEKEVSKANVGKYGKNGPSLNANVHLANGVSGDLDTGDDIGKRFGEDTARLKVMLLKLVRQYNVKSMADVPCRAHSHWMPDFLQNVAEWDENFKYICVDADSEVLRAMKDRIGLVVDAKFVQRKFWRERIPKVDLVLSWAGLDNMREENVVNYVKRLSRAGRRHQFVLLGSHSGGLEQAPKDKIRRFTGGGKLINFRRRPFYLYKPLRIIRDLSVDGNDKQMYLYATDSMYKGKLP